MPDGKPLWICPECGKQFVGVNMWHSCGPHTVEGFLEGKARALSSGVVRQAHRRSVA